MTGLAVRKVVVLYGWEGGARAPAQPHSRQYRGTPSPAFASCSISFGRRSKLELENFFGRPRARRRFTASSTKCGPSSPQCLEVQLFRPIPTLQGQGTHAARLQPSTARALKWKRHLVPLSHDVQSQLRVIKGLGFFFLTKGGGGDIY